MEFADVYLATLCEYAVVLIYGEVDYSQRRYTNQFMTDTPLLVFPAFFAFPLPWSYKRCV